MNNLPEKILVFGAGKMIEAIFTGLNSSLDLSNVSFFSPSGTSAKALAEKLGAQHVVDLDSVHPDLLMIGCKPQQIKELKSILGARFLGVPVISILAALPEQTQSEILGASDLVRVMPNLAVAKRQGVSLLSSRSSASFLARTKEIFSLLGHVEEVSEEELEELTLLTGSSPAFFYEFASLIARSFSSLTQEKRELLIRKSFLGAALTVRDSQKNLEELVQDVTSKGGVTIAVLEELRRQKLSLIIKDGISRGQERGKEIQSLILRS